MGRGWARIGRRVSPSVADGEGTHSYSTVDCVIADRSSSSGILFQSDAQETGDGIFARLFGDGSSRRPLAGRGPLGLSLAHGVRKRARSGLRLNGGRVGNRIVVLGGAGGGVGRWIAGDGRSDNQGGTEKTRDDRSNGSSSGGSSSGSGSGKGRLLGQFSRTGMRGESLSLAGKEGAPCIDRVEIWGQRLDEARGGGTRGREGRGAGVGGERARLLACGWLVDRSGGGSAAVVEEVLEGVVVVVQQWSWRRHRRIGSGRTVGGRSLDQLVSGRRPRAGLRGSPRAGARRGGRRGRRRRGR